MVLYRPAAGDALKSVLELKLSSLAKLVFSLPLPCMFGPSHTMSAV
jgi:hypothetical protein